MKPLRYLCLLFSTFSIRKNNRFIDAKLFFFKNERFFFVILKICRYFAQILILTMNQQEIRSKYYLHSDVLHPESADFFFFSPKTIF